MEQHIPLRDLEVYQLARELSTIGWTIYERFDWQDKKIMGDQYIEATDSVGANIAEGYGRFHFLDRIKFYYNARGSLYECSDHWIELLYTRKRVSQEQYQQFKDIALKLLTKLNNLITSLYRVKNQKYNERSE